MAVAACGGGGRGPTEFVYRDSRPAERNLMFKGKGVVLVSILIVYWGR